MNQGNIKDGDVVLVGTTVCQGEVRGTARVVTNLAEANLIQVLEKASLIVDFCKVSHLIVILFTLKINYYKQMISKQQCITPVIISNLTHEFN